MQFLIGLLAALGVAVESLAARGALLALLRTLTAYGARVSTITARYKRMIKAALALDLAAQGYDVYVATKEAVREWLSDILDEVIGELDKESVKKAIGKALAKYIKTLVEVKFGRYGIEFPIQNLYSPTIVEELSDWFCDIINTKVGQKLRHEVVVVNALFPPDNIFKDLDAFITNEINLILGTNFTSMLTDIVKIKQGGIVSENQLRDYLNGEFINGYKMLLKTKIDAIEREAGSLAGATLVSQRTFIINRLGQEVFAVNFLRKGAQARNRVARLKKKNNIKQKAYRDKVTNFRFNKRVGENDIFINNMVENYRIKNEALLLAKKNMSKLISKQKRFMGKNGMSPSLYSGQVLADYNAILAELNPLIGAYNAAKF